MAIYSVDSRGLQALPPVGDASTGSLRGNSAYSGASATAQFELGLWVAGDAGYVEFGYGWEVVYGFE